MTRNTYGKTMRILGVVFVVGLEIVLFAGIIIIFIKW
jgi:hypothetical protein